jgi:hypothetical protein
VSAYQIHHDGGDVHRFSQENSSLIVLLKKPYKNKLLKKIGRLMKNLCSG